jgi:hypothetical protein
MVSLVYAMELLGAEKMQGLIIALLVLGGATFYYALRHFRRSPGR